MLYGIKKSKILVNTGSGNGMLPDDTKSLPEPILTFHQQDPLAFIPILFTWISIPKFCLKFTYLKSQPHLPGDGELMDSTSYHCSKSDATLLWAKLIYEH